MDCFSSRFSPSFCGQCLFLKCVLTVLAVLLEYLQLRSGQHFFLPAVFTLTFFIHRSIVECLPFKRLLDLNAYPSPSFCITVEKASCYEAVVNV
ncbi:hypothetical protein EDC94DRAFT_611753 [Helicostylum pulchrum]|nr:hypothetical protein EDC94DRAFT_611753 [Helicostylum pulchrum]